MISEEEIKTKEELIIRMSNPITRPIGLLQGLFLVAFIISLFIWIWGDFHLALKLTLTGILGVLITKFFDYIVKKVVTEIVEQEIKTKSEKKIGNSRFQKKLRKMMEEYD